MARTAGEGPASTSRDRTLSAVLRAAYEKAKAENGLSLRALGAQVGTSHSTLHRWFTGAGVPGYEEVVSIVAALGIVGDEKESILELARNPGPNLVTTGPPGVSQELAGVMELERSAAAMTVWMPLFIPGMLQTGSYARAVATAGSQTKMAEAELDHLVTLRLGRQNAITRSAPIRLHAYIGEPAIRGNVGGRDVMNEQLDYLLRATEYDAVTIQTVPVHESWHAGLIGPFVLYDFPNGQSIIYLEHHGSGVFLDEDTDVEAYRSLRDVLSTLAASPEESRAQIARERQRETT